MRCGSCGRDGPDGMRFCGHCGTPLAAEQGAASRLGAATRRHMTVMSCDVVDSTPLAESLDPEDWREILNAYQRVCAGAIERWGGYTARYIGDGVVAYFGYPRAHEDDARRAVHAGLSLIAELGKLNERLGAEHGIALQVRIGLHSGIVVAGEIGAGDALARHEVVGEMPHIAARLEKEATPMSIAISDQTRALVDGYFDTEALGRRSLKGVSRQIGVHRVVGATGATGRLEVTGGGPLPPLVGRTEELAALTAAWEAALAG